MNGVNNMCHGFYYSRVLSNHDAQLIYCRNLKLLYCTNTSKSGSLTNIVRLNSELKDE